MSEIIKNGRIEASDWIVLRLAETDAAASVALPAGRVIVPLAVWQAQRAELLPKAEAGMVGVWLAGDADPAELAPDLSKLQLVAVDFPKFADGRGYSIATLLRTRHGRIGSPHEYVHSSSSPILAWARSSAQRAAGEPTAKLTTEICRAFVLVFVGFGPPSCIMVRSTPLGRRP